jgi:hypothetical protein
MKKKLVQLFTVIALATSAHAAVTFTFANYTGSTSGPNGLPIVNSSGFAITNASNSIFASLGYLTPGVDNSAAGILSRFVPIDNSPTTVTASPARPGLFGAADYNSAGNVYPTGFQGQTVVALIGNNTTIANSTAIAAFTFGGVTYQAPDPVTFARVQSFQLTSSSTPLIGTVTPMANTTTAQPNSATTNPFVNGVQLVAIPETSTSLLGAIGALALLRRRRN